MNLLSAGRAKGGGLAQRRALFKRAGGVLNFEV
jgi:hypothetical protein